MASQVINLIPCERLDIFGRPIMPIKYGYVSKIGEPFEIPPLYDSASEFSEKIAPGVGPLAFVEINRKWGLINPDGSYFIEPKFYRIHEFHEGISVISVVSNELKDWGFIKLDGSFLVPPMFERAEDFKDGYAKVLGSSETRGFLRPDGSYALKSMRDIENKIERESDYDDIKIVGVSLNGRVGFIDHDGYWHDCKK